MSPHYTRINRVKTIGLTTYLHSLDIFKVCISMWIKCWYLLNTKKAFDSWIFLCLISPSEFYALRLWIHNVSQNARDQLINKLLERVGGAVWPWLKTLPSLIVISVVKLEIHLFANITWLHVDESRDSMVAINST